MWFIISLILAVLLVLAALVIIGSFKLNQDLTAKVEAYAQGNAEIEESLQQEILSLEDTKAALAAIVQNQEVEIGKLISALGDLEERHDKLGSDFDIMRFIATQHTEHCLPTVSELQAKVLLSAKNGEIDLTQSWKQYIAGDVSDVPEFESNIEFEGEPKGL